MAEHKVLLDRIAWYDEDGNRRFADRGDMVALPEGEADRLSSIGAIGSEDDYVPRELLMARRQTGTRMTSGPGAEVEPQEGVSRTSADDEPSTVKTDDELAAMSVDETVAHLQQHPEDVDRIDALEDQRSSRRKGVDETLETIRSNRG